MHSCHGLHPADQDRDPGLTILRKDFKCLWRLCQEGNVEDGEARPPGTHRLIFKFHFSSRLSIPNFSGQPRDRADPLIIKTFCPHLCCTPLHPSPPHHLSQPYAPRFKCIGVIFRSRTPRQATTPVTPSHTRLTLAANPNHHPTNTRIVLRSTLHLCIILLVSFLPNIRPQTIPGFSTPGAIGASPQRYGRSPDLRPCADGNATDGWPIH